LGRGKTIGAFASKCITEAEFWVAKYDTGRSATTNNNRQAHPEKNKEASAPPPPATHEPFITDKTELPVTIHLATLQLYDEFTAMDKEKPTRDQTKKDWQDMDKKAMELLDYMK
jgi:hypothetical protein